MGSSLDGSSERMSRKYAANEAYTAAIEHWAFSESESWHSA